MTQQINVTICNKLGLHARASAKLTQLCSAFKGVDIFIAKTNRLAQKVNAKSIMGVMMLAAANGVEVQLDATITNLELALESFKNFGENIQNLSNEELEQLVLKKVEALILNRFDEAE